MLCERRRDDLCLDLATLHTINIIIFLSLAVDHLPFVNREMGS